MSLTKVSYSLINGAPVNLLDFIPAGVDIANDDCSAYIQNALDSKTSNAVIYGGGLNYRCESGIVIKGGNKVLDMGNGTLTFVNSSPTYAVTIETVTATAAGQEYNNAIRNARIDCSGLTSGGGDNIGVYVHNKVLDCLIENVHIYSVDGSGIYVDGGLDGSGFFMSPDKGLISNVVIDSCDTGVYFVTSTINAVMTGWTLQSIYAPTCDIAFNITGCSQFSMVGLASESYTVYGLKINDLGYGGGHILSGGFFESSAGGSKPFHYENANPNNSNVVLAKGSFETSAKLTDNPSMTLSFGNGVVVNQTTLPVWDFNTTSPQLLSKNPFGCVATIMGRSGAYARVYFGSDYANRVTAGPFTNGTVYIITTVGDTNWAAVGLSGTATVGSMFTGNGASSGTTGVAAPMSTEILEQSSLSLFTTTAGTGNKVNVYPATVGNVTGMYLQNNAPAGTGFGATVIGGVSILNMN